MWFERRRGAGSATDRPYVARTIWDADGARHGDIIHAQTEAKKFFVEKVLTEANRERVTLTKAEERMLSWSESDPDFTAEH